jgi:hypothetical protein
VSSSVGRAMGCVKMGRHVWALVRD